MHIITSYTCPLQYKIQYIHVAAQQQKDSVVYTTLDNVRVLFSAGTSAVTDIDVAVGLDSSFANILPPCGSL